MRTACQSDIHSINNYNKPDPSRIRDAVDLIKMRESHVLGIGVGGAKTLYEDLVRTWLGKLTVVDYDFVSETNVISQGYDCNQIGQQKVKALGNDLRNINPEINFTGIQDDFLKMTEEQIGELVKGKDLLLMMTDNFYAQARGNLVSIKYRIPTVFAIVYTYGSAAEITFNYPGVTSACHRCITAGRYKAYAKGFKDPVGSSGTPVFAAHLLNAVLGFISLAILLKGTNTHYGSLISRIENRNFIQIRMSPDFNISGNDVFGKFLGRRKTIFCYDSIWLFPDNPPAYECCPDCHSLGDLIQSSKLINETIPQIF